MQGERPADQFIAVRREFLTPEEYAFHRGIDVLVGLLLIANYLRTTGVFIGESGTTSFTVSGPLLTRAVLERFFLRPGDQAPPETPEGGSTDA